MMIEVWVEVSKNMLKIIQTRVMDQPLFGLPVYCAAGIAELV
jgi:hypothetical protein